MMSEASSALRAARRRATSGRCCVGGSGRELGDGRAPRTRWSLQHHDLLKGFESGHAGKQLHEVGTEQVGHGEEKAGARRAQDVASFLSAVSGIQRYQHCADGVDGEAGDHPFGAVGGPQGHAISGLDTTPHKCARHLVHSFGQLTKGKSSRPVDERFVVPVILRCLIQRVRDRPRLPIIRLAVFVLVVRHECIYYASGGA